MASDQLERAAGQVVESVGIGVAEDRLGAGHRRGVLMFAECDLGQHQVQLDPQALIGGIERQRLLAQPAGAREIQRGVR